MRARSAPSEDSSTRWPRRLCSTSSDPLLLTLLPGYFLPRAEGGCGASLRPIMRTPKQAPGQAVRWVRRRRAARTARSKGARRGVSPRARGSADIKPFRTSYIVRHVEPGALELACCRVLYPAMRPGSRTARSNEHRGLARRSLVNEEVTADCGLL